MEHSMDPYEQQLLSVFNNYDITHRGSLDREGLQQLCNSLQLEEQGVELIKCLLSDDTKQQVTFTEFKDGLLALLGKLQNQDEASDREVSPKFVYGSKKYGRRSRPESTEQIEFFDTDRMKSAEVFIENKPLKNLNKVQRSNSQSDVTHSRKRLTNGKLKRCTSFPGNGDMEKQFNKTWKKEAKKPAGDTMLNIALDQLDIGLDGYINESEFYQVCEYLGVNKYAKSLLQEIHKNESDRICIEDFLEVMQRNNDLFEDGPDQRTTGCITEDSVVFPIINKSLQYITLGPNGSGVVSSQILIELWENAGINSAPTLLQELGFTENSIVIVDLAMILEDELRSLTESRTDISHFTQINPHIVLLQASIALYQSEVKYLKSLLEQLVAERTKLRADISDANHRATLLAQEIDDNHAKMEQNTQHQVRALEQRNSDMIKELTAQFVAEKEQFAAQNIQLEQKIVVLENEEVKLKASLQTLHDYNFNLEKENNLLVNQLSDLEQVRAALTEKVNILETECQKITDIEHEQNQLEPLIEKLSILQLENAELRDKNDELCTEIESLNSKVSALRTKLTPTLFNVNTRSSTTELFEENVSNICEGVGLGAIKRRVDSPTKETHDCSSSIETETPRLGKMRRCYTQKFQQQQQQQQTGEILLDALGAVQQMPLNSSESGFEAELDCLDSSLSFTGSESYSTSGDEVQNLHARVLQLEQLLAQNSITIPANNTTNSKNVAVTKEYLIRKCKELESLFEDIQSTVVKMVTDKYDCTEEKCDLYNPITQLSDKLNNIKMNNDESHMKITTVDNSTETDETFSEIQLENRQLNERCEDLETALELLRKEFENCENYWENKLDEERQMFEQEQRISSDKLNELLAKMTEYEAQFNISNTDTLDTIDESILEQQYADLEDEYKKYKDKIDACVEEKEKKIVNLQKQIELLENKKVENISIQVDIDKEYKINNNLSSVITNTNIFASESFPHDWKFPTNQSDSIDSSVIDSNYVNTSVWNKPESTQSTTTSDPEPDAPTYTSLPTASVTQYWHPPLYNPSVQQPQSLNANPSYTLTNTNAPYRPIRSRKYDRNVIKTKQEQDLLNKQSKGKENSFQNGSRSYLPRVYAAEDQMCISLNAFIHLQDRSRQLDQYCRHLKHIMNQQQKNSESLMQRCWSQYRDEVAELKLQIQNLEGKLARSDMLVKDIWVENTHLMRNHELLKRQYQKLLQTGTENTSV